MPSKPDRMTAPAIRQMKARGERIVCLTAYDIVTARIAEEAGVDVVLVGDSMANVVLGFDTTLPVTLEHIVHHTAAVRRAVKRSLLVADMPFGSYGSSVGQAVDSAVALARAGAEAVKLEGAYTEEIRAIIKAGIPVMGHVGMTPQSVNNFGGFKAQGKGESSHAVVEAARAIDEAGAFAIVLELIPGDLAATITAAVGCATIGIGAGVHCDGEVQVFHDITGLGTFQPRHTKLYVDAGRLLADGVKQYVEDVRACKFPGEQQTL